MVMATTMLKGNVVNLAGDFIGVGEMAPEFSLVRGNLGSMGLGELRGKNVILNVFPSLDTAVCASSVRKFNKIASEMENTVVLCISKDLPFAQTRFCTTEGLENVVPLSDFRFDSSFGRDYGLLMVDGPLKGLLARSIVVVSPEGKVVYTELVPEIAQEPDYEAALDVLA